MKVEITRKFEKKVGKEKEVTVVFIIDGVRYEGCAGGVKSLYSVSRAVLNTVCGEITEKGHGVFNTRSDKFTVGTDSVCIDFEDTLPDVTDEAVSIETIRTSYQNVLPGRIKKVRAWIATLASEKIETVQIEL